MTTNYSKYAIYNLSSGTSKKTKKSKKVKGKIKFSKKRKKVQKKKSNRVFEDPIAFPDIDYFLSKTSQMIKFDIHQRNLYVSPREEQVARLLAKFKLEYRREVSLHGLFNKDTGCPFRFDFLVIIDGQGLLVEYDGARHFTCNITKKRDEIKNHFCHTHGIRLLRLNKFNWSNRNVLLHNMISNFF